MNNYETFEDILIDNDFSVHEKPEFDIPKDVDVGIQYGAYSGAYLKMAETNRKIARSVASKNYDLLE